MVLGVFLMVLIIFGLVALSFILYVIVLFPFWDTNTPKLCFDSVFLGQGLDKITLALQALYRLNMTTWTDGHVWQWVRARLIKAFCLDSFYATHCEFGFGERYNFM